MAYTNGTYNDTTDYEIVWQHETGMIEKRCYVQEQRHFASQSANMVSTGLFSYYDDSEEYNQDPDYGNNYITIATLTPGQIDNALNCMGYVLLPKKPIYSSHVIAELNSWALHYLKTPHRPNSEKELFPGNPAAFLAQELEAVRFSEMADTLVPEMLVRNQGLSVDAFQCLLDVLIRRLSVPSDRYLDLDPDNEGIKQTLSLLETLVERLLPDLSGFQWVGTTGLKIVQERTQLVWSALAVSKFFENLSPADLWCVLDGYKPREWDQFPLAQGVVKLLIWKILFSSEVNIHTCSVWMTVKPTVNGSVMDKVNALKRAVDNVILGWDLSDATLARYHAIFGTEE